VQLQRWIRVFGQWYFEPLLPICPKRWIQYKAISPVEGFCLGLGPVAGDTGKMPMKFGCTPFHPMEIIPCLRMVETSYMTSLPTYGEMFWVIHNGVRLTVRSPHHEPSGEILESAPLLYVSTLNG
jgi:hypothetical protein